MTALNRAAEAVAFLAQAGWGNSIATHLAGDMSPRSYQRIRRGQETAVLMDAPPGTGDDPADFIAVAEHLIALGLSPPRIIAKDLARGFLLLEDLGDGLFARLIADDPALEGPLTSAAVDVLAHLQNHPAPTGLPDLTAGDWADAASLALTVYAPVLGAPGQPQAEITACLADVLARHADDPRVLILRDYHAENLLWLPDRQGLARVGLLDFQLAQMGQPLYDLVSLLQDARRDVAPETEAEMIRRFADVTGRRVDPAAYAALGAQRALRILGIVARIATQGRRPAYLRLLPRVWGQLQRNLAHPALMPLARLCAGLPAPTAANLTVIEDTCPPMP